MTTDDESVSSVISIVDTGQPGEYYEEFGAQQLQLQKQKVPPAPVPIRHFISPIPVPVDPLRKLNEELNRKYRPDLVPPTPQPPPPAQIFFAPPAVQRTPSPDPVIYDSRAIPKEKLEKRSSVGIKQKLFNRMHQITTVTSASDFHSTSKMPDQTTTNETSYLPPGMMLVPDPSYQAAQHNGQLNGFLPQSNAYQTVSYYQPPTVIQAPPFKYNRVAPPPTNSYQYPMNNSVHTTNSLMSTNPLLHASQASQLPSHYDYQSQSTKKKLPTNGGAPMTNGDKSFALYNQKNGRIEGVEKNRSNVVANESGDSRLVDEDPNRKSNLGVWLSQPLCMGLTRLSGGILFGSMVILGVGSIAGLIASIVTYSQDSTTNAQWKILGMVVCAIMLITIIVTLLIFICCYKNGYMFNSDEDDDLTDPSTTRDADGNERSRAALRNIYKFNRPTETPLVIPQNNFTPAPPIQPYTVLVTDKQTNTEATIATILPRDFDRGVWKSNNAYGGKAYRPIIAPPTMSRFTQVFPHEIEAAYPPPKIVYQVVAPASAISPVPEAPRVIRIPAPQAPVFEVVEKPVKASKPQIVQAPAPQAPVFEVVEKPVKASKSQIVQAPTQQVAAPATTRYEYVEMEDSRPRRIVQQPQYQIVEEVLDQSNSSTMEEFVEIIDVPEEKRRRGKKKDKKRRGGNIFVKHIKAPKD